MAADRELAAVQAVALRADAKADAALDVLANRHGYLTVLGYCRLTGRRVCERTAGRHGRELSARCRRQGITIGRSGSERYGYVNSYPAEVIAAYFSNAGLPAVLTRHAS